MVAQLREPIQTLSWLLPPQMPPVGQLNAYGYRVETDGSHTVTKVGERVGPVGQRIVAAYLLRLQTREQLAERYDLSARQVQQILSGTARAYLIAPVFERLRRLGIDDAHSRSIKGDRAARLEAVRDAQARLGARAVAMIREPLRYSAAERERVAADLWLLSGAWLEDRP